MRIFPDERYRLGFDRASDDDFYVGPLGAAVVQVQNILPARADGSRYPAEIAYWTRRFDVLCFEAVIF